MPESSDGMCQVPVDPSSEGAVVKEDGMSLKFEVTELPWVKAGVN